MITEDGLEVKYRKWLKKFFPYPFINPDDKTLIVFARANKASILQKFRDFKAMVKPNPRAFG